MQLHPTRNAVDLTLVGLMLVCVGLFLGQAAILAWGGAILVGLMIARAVTLLSVARVRAAGFEMLWSQTERFARTPRGRTLELEAEVRNRDSRAARYVELRALHSPFLEVKLSPAFGEVPAGGRLAVSVTIEAKRVGRHGVFGLSLEVQGSPGLYEVPLTFSNPFGVEVLPGAYSAYTRSARGGRSHMRTDDGRAGKRRGGNDELRELREYLSGDSFKRIAWRASARRGQLMVKEYEIEEKDVVWIFLDCSVELWAGVPGEAPLDRAIERAGWLVEQHGARGDRVGLCLIGARRLGWFPPQRGAPHMTKLLDALAFDTGTYDTDRSGLDEGEVAARVLEHMRPLEPTMAENLRSHEVDRIARRAVLALKRAPFQCSRPLSPSPREQSLRHYLKSFGIESPARLEPDRPRTDQALILAFKEAIAMKPKPSLVVVCAPVPDARDSAELIAGLKTLPRARAEVRWIPTHLADGMEPTSGSVNRAVRYAIELRTNTQRDEGERRLRRAGIKVERLAERTKPPPGSAEENGNKAQTERELAAL